MTIAFTNNASPPEMRGSITGILVLFETAAKAAGPVLAAIAFAWTLDRWGRSGHGIVFIFLAVAHVIFILVVASLPSVVENAPQIPAKCSEEKEMVMPDKP